MRQPRYSRWLRHAGARAQAREPDPHLALIIRRVVQSLLIGLIQDEGQIMEVMMLDQGKLQQFVQKMLGDLGGATSIALVRIGHSLGLYKAMEGAGPMTSAQFASKASIAERYAREWLSHQTASGYISHTNPHTARSSCRLNRRWSLRMKTARFS